MSVNKRPVASTIVRDLVKLLGGRIMFEAGVVYRNEDSYCGPISMLTKLPGGELLLAFREAKWRERVTHRDPTTRVSLLRSRDGGLTWFSHVTPDAAGGNGVGLTRLSNGIVIVTAYHWRYALSDDARELEGMPRQGEDGAFGLPYAGAGVFRTFSHTDGYTWEDSVHIEEPPGWPDIACHAQPIELPDGDLLLPVTGRKGPEGQSHGMILRSEDEALTWGDPVCMTDDAPDDVNFHETRLVLCPSGKIVGMHRTPDGNYWQNVSTDGGHSWSESMETPIWCGGSSPPDLRLLDDGRLLLTRGYRREPFGVRAYLSDDEGESWSVDNPIVLRDDGLDRDVGYPSTAQREDGSMLTVYYWHEEDQIRHLQRTIWDLPD